MSENMETPQIDLTTTLRSLASPLAVAVLLKKTRADFAVSIAELSKEFGVSEPYIRANLRMIQQHILRGIQQKNLRPKMTPDLPPTDTPLEQAISEKGMKDGKRPSSRG